MKKQLTVTAKRRIVATAHCLLLLPAAASAQSAPVTALPEGNTATEWTACAHSGFTQVTNINAEEIKTMGWANAKALCERKGSGWRMPAKEELECLCENRESLPGAYLPAAYWSSTPYGANYYYIVYFYSDRCVTYYQRPDYRWGEYVKCVK
jgi:hypothetical protein